MSVTRTESVSFTATMTSRGDRGVDGIALASGSAGTGIGNFGTVSLSKNEISEDGYEVEFCCAGSSTIGSKGAVNLLWEDLLDTLNISVRDVDKIKYAMFSILNPVHGGNTPTLASAGPHGSPQVCNFGIQATVGDAEDAKMVFCHAVPLLHPVDGWNSGTGFTIGNPGDGSITLNWSFVGTRFASNHEIDSIVNSGGKCKINMLEATTLAGTEVLDIIRTSVFEYNTTHTLTSKIDSKTFVSDQTYTSDADGGWWREQ